MEYVKGFRVEFGLGYDLDHHIWVEEREPGRVRVGMDPLGVETSGTLAQMAFAAVGTEVRRGEPFGTLEAEKFVGPLVSPLSGAVTAVNEAVAADPGLVDRDPYGAWLVELALTDPDELAALVREPADVVAAFEAKVTRYRIEGVLAE